VKTKKLPEALIPYSGDEYLSTKQVASATFLSGFHDTSLTYSNRELCIENGVGIHTPLYSTGVLSREEDEGDLLSLEKGGLTPSPRLSTDATEEVISLKPKIDYRDPWKIYASRAFKSRRAEKLPDLKIWQATISCLQDPIDPTKIEGFTGNLKRKIKWVCIAEPKCQISVLQKHTFWGKQLQRMRYSTEPGERNWATLLWKRIKSFLLNKIQDPQNKRIEELTTHEKPFRRGERASRFLELLKTCDGIFLQRYLTFPEEVWTWEKFDRFTLWNIAHLLGDEFLDGVPTEKGISHITSFQTLKKVRKTVKLALHSNDPSVIFGKNIIPKWLSWFYPLLREVFNQPDELRLLSVGLLSQTRGCGKPPKLMSYQAGFKFLKTVSELPPPLPLTVVGIVRSCLDLLDQEVPKEIFTGLHTKAGISITTSADYTYTRLEGGTLQAIKDIVDEAIKGRPVPIRNLETGQLEGTLLYEESNPGTYIFWASLEVCLSIPLIELTSVKEIIVKEPAKCRTVTKGRACLKVVLDTINHICSFPLGKIQTSTSGMTMSHHGWNLFKSFFKDEKREIFFHTESSVESKYESHSEVTESYSDVFISSTDFEEATDYENFEIARLLGTHWMSRCGIPKWLKAFVIQTCYKPRKIYFEPVGPFKNLGFYDPVEKQNYIVSKRGLMMGDPLTKVVLHLTNICIRLTTKVLSNIDILSKHFTNASEVQRVFL